MKHILTILIIFMITACSALQPQATVTPTLAPTDTPIPTPTLNPQFIELQEQVAAASERLILLPDGSIEDRGVPIQGIHVSPEGVMVLTVNDEEITLDPAEVTFSDENGFQPKDYKSEEGKWVPAKEIITTSRGIGIELGEQMPGQVDGVRALVDFIPPENTKDKPAFEKKLDPTTLGFAEDATQWVYIPTADGKYRIVLQSATDPTNEIAELGNSEVIWDMSDILTKNTDSVLLTGAKVWEMKGGVIKDSRIASSAQLRMIQSIIGILPRQSSITTNFQVYIVTSRNGKQGVVISFLQTGDDPSIGFACLIGSDGNPLVIFTHNFDTNLRRFTR